MPDERLAYSCHFRCGRRVVLSRASMAKHEGTCLRNPDRRACTTCAHDIPPERGNHDPDYSPEGGYCAKDARGEKMCIVNCPQWERGL